jgi:hypothetical protein
VSGRVYPNGRKERVTCTRCGKDSTSGVGFAQETVAMSSKKQGEHYAQGTGVCWDCARHPPGTKWKGGTLPNGCELYVMPVGWKPGDAIKEAK